MLAVKTEINIGKKQTMSRMDLNPDKMEADMRT
jgi:hypothetical protein